MLTHRFYIKLIGFLVLVFTSLLPFYTTNDFFWGVAVISFFILVKYISTISGIGGFTQLGLNSQVKWKRNLFIGFIIGGIHSFILFVILMVIGAVNIQGIASVDQAISFFILNGISTCFIAFAEEIVIRGYLFKLLVNKFSIHWVMIMTSLVFMGYHFLKWGAPLSSWIGWFVMGFYFLIPVLITGTLWLSIGLHWGINFIYFGLLTSEGIMIIQSGISQLNLIDWIPVLLNMIMIPIIITISYLLKERTKVVRPRLID